MRAAVISCCLFVAAAFPQSPSSEAYLGSVQAKQFLQSTSLLQRAWGVHLLSSLDPSEASPQLISELKNTETANETALASHSITAEYSYVQVLLDALIQIKAKPDGELLRKLWVRFPTEVLILLIENAGSNQNILLSLLEEGLQEKQWLAVCNTLLAIKSPELPVLLLKDMRISHTFTVIDKVEGGFGGGAGGVSIGCGVRYLTAGFPPTGIYKIEDYPQNGNTILALGPKIIYYRREVIPTSRQIGWNQSSSFNNRQPYRLDYLAELSGMTSGEVQHAFERQTSVRWTSLTDFERTVSTGVDSQRAELSKVFEAISQHSEILNKAFPLHLQIDIQVKDRRTDQAIALPSFEAVPVLQ